LGSNNKVAAVVCLVNNHNSMPELVLDKLILRYNKSTVYFRQTYEDPGWWSDVFLQSLGSSISSPQPESWSGTNRASLAPKSGNEHVVGLIFKPFIPGLFG
jgi:hypothetical protein